MTVAWLNLVSSMKFHLDMIWHMMYDIMYIIMYDMTWDNMIWCYNMIWYVMLLCCYAMAGRQCNVRYISHVYYIKVCGMFTVIIFIYKYLTGWFWDTCWRNKDNHMRSGPSTLVASEGPEIILAAANHGTIDNPVPRSHSQKYLQGIPKEKIQHQTRVLKGVFRCI